MPSCYLAKLLMESKDPHLLLFKCPSSYISNFHSATWVVHFFNPFRGPRIFCYVVASASISMFVYIATQMVCAYFCV